MNEYIKRAEKIADRINELAAITEEEGHVTRTFGTKAFIEGSKKVFSWMKDAGMKTWMDNIGNVRGLLLSNNPDAKIFVIASHIDTVVNAGKFDGPLGVIMGLDIVEHLISSKINLPFHIELIAFSDEEGVRFHTTYLGSKVVTGAFDKSLLEKKDAAGISLKDVIDSIDGNPDKLPEDAISRRDWFGYFEIHIEQGPVLYEKNIPIAVVTAIAGQKRVEIIFRGTAGHAGTVPMDMRNDALCAAAEFVLAVEEFGIAEKNTIVATIGKLGIHHAASNVIPGKVICSLDLRSADAVILSSSYQSIKDLCEAICKERNIGLEWHLVQQTMPVACDEKLNSILQRAVSKSGYELVQLVSGAGHDAVPVSAIVPVSMLFVRCYKGISHNPMENVEIKDIAAAIKVSDNFMHGLAAPL